MPEARTSPLRKAAATVAAAASSFAAASSDSAVLPAPPRPGEQYFLEIEGLAAGALGLFAGGERFMDTVFASTKRRYPRKRPGALQFEAIEIAVSLDMAPGFWEWLAAALGPRPSLRRGAIITTDGSGQVLSRVEFSGAAITEVAFPALDASSREAAAIALKLAPEHVEHKSAAGQRSDVTGQAARRWGASNFHVSVDGMDFSAAKALKVSSITAQCGHSPTDPSSVSNFTVTVPATTAEQLAEWHRQTIRRAATGKASPRNATITYLAPDLSTTLGTMRLANAGILRLVPEKAEGRSKARNFVATLYAESVALSVAPSPA